MDREKDPLSDSESYTSDFTYQAIMDNPSGGVGTSARFVSQASTSDEDLLDITHGGSTGLSHHQISQSQLTGGAGLEEGQQEDFPGLGQYDDFHTIDWLRDIARDRMRHRHIVKKRLEVNRE